VDDFGSSPTGRNATIVKRNPGERDQ